jgi:hypothetical protein
MSEYSMRPKERKMIKLFSMAVLVAMLAIGTWAHGTDTHVMGAVTKISGHGSQRWKATDKQVTVVKTRGRIPRL